MIHFLRRCHVVRLCLTLAAAIAVGTLAMIAVYALPTAPMVYHVERSLPLFETEHDSYAWAPGHLCTFLDNFTSSLMVQSAILPRRDSLVQDAMMNGFLLYTAEPFTHGDLPSMSESVRRQIHEDGTAVWYPYPRYWHGYLTVLKPMLLLADVAYLRMLNLLIQVLLTADVLLLLWDRLGRGAAVSYLLAYLLLNPISLVLSFQYTAVYCIAAGCAIFALRRMEDGTHAGGFHLTFFLLAGILTAFFDFLTYPLVSLGIPLTIALCLAHRYGALRTLRDGLPYAFAASAAWCFGYAGMFGGKWLVGWLLTGVNVPADAIHEAMSRMSAPEIPVYGGQVGVFGVWKEVLKMLQHDPIALLLGLSLLAALWQLWRSRARVAAIWQEKRVLCLLLGTVALYPFVWYAVIKNHSYLHAWMVYRDLAITVFALGCLLSVLLPKRNG